jgi:hypothetical protein
MPTSAGGAAQSRARMSNCVAPPGLNTFFHLPRADARGYLRDAPAALALLGYGDMNRLLSANEISAVAQAKTGPAGTDR